MVNRALWTLLNQERSFPDAQLLMGHVLKKQGVTTEKGKTEALAHCLRLRREHRCEGHLGTPGWDRSNVLRLHRLRNLQMLFR